MGVDDVVACGALRGATCELVCWQRVRRCKCTSILMGLRERAQLLGHLAH